MDVLLSLRMIFFLFRTKHFSGCIGHVRNKCGCWPRNSSSWKPTYAQSRERLMGCWTNATGSSAVSRRRFVRWKGSWIVAEIASRPTSQTSNNKQPRWLQSTGRNLWPRWQIIIIISRIAAKYKTSHPPVRPRTAIQQLNFKYEF